MSDSDQVLPLFTEFAAALQKAADLVDAFDLDIQDPTLAAIWRELMADALAVAYGLTPLAEDNADRLRAELDQIRKMIE